MIKYNDIVVITAYTYFMGNVYDSQPLTYAPELEEEFKKMVKNYQKGLIPYEPTIVKYDDYYIQNPVLY